MFTLSGKFFSVNKTSQFTLWLGKTSESIAAVWSKPVTLQKAQGGWNITTVITIKWYLVDVTRVLSDGCTITDVTCCLLCCGANLSPLLYSTTWPVYHSCLNTSCCTKSVTGGYRHTEHTTAQRGKSQTVKRAEGGHGLGYLAMWIFEVFSGGVALC